MTPTGDGRRHGGPFDGHGVPFGDLARVVRRHKANLDSAMEGVMTRGWFVLGRELEAFEAAFAAYCGVRHAVGVGNGTDAIALGLRAAGIGPGDEVVTTPLSAAFTALGIVQCGARPVFADVDPDTLNLDPAAVERAVSPHTRAILPVHLYGGAADMPGLRRVAEARGLGLAEDAAQAHGAALSGIRCGAWGDWAAFSFYPSKNLGAFGDAGAVVTNDPEIAASVRRLRNGGQTERYRHEVPGVNSRLDELQAAVLQVRLSSLDLDNARRRDIAARYASALAEAPGLRLVGSLDGGVHARHLFVVRCSNRDAVAAAFAEAGVATAVHYPTPIHLQPAFRGVAEAGSLPVAERACTEVLSLPIFPELEDAEVDRVVSAIAEVGRRGPDASP